MYDGWELINVNKWPREGQPFPPLAVTWISTLPSQRLRNGLLGEWEQFKPRSQ